MGIKLDHLIVCMKRGRIRDIKRVIWNKGVRYSSKANSVGNAIYIIWKKEYRKNTQWFQICTLKKTLSGQKIMNFRLDFHWTVSHISNCMWSINVNSCKDLFIYVIWLIIFGADKELICTLFSTVPMKPLSKILEESTRQFVNSFFVVVVVFFFLVC